MIEVIEKFESRRITTASHPTVELRYDIRGTNDDVEARSALVDNSPTLYDPWGGGLLFLPRESVSIEPVGDELWEGIVRYDITPATEQSVFAFDTGGGTQHITEVAVPRELFAAILDRIQQFRVPPPLVQRG